MASVKPIEMWSGNGSTTESTFFFKVITTEPTELVDVQRKVNSRVPTARRGDFFQGEFRISLPGAYRLTHREDFVDFVVHEYKPFPLAYELGATAFAVALFWVALFVFKKRRRYGRTG